MKVTERDRTTVRRNGLLLSGILAVIGLVLLVLGLTVARGTVAGIEVALAIVLLLGSYALQFLARRETLYRREER